MPGKRKRRRPKRRLMDAAREDKAMAEVTEEHAGDSAEWPWKIRCDDI